MLGNRMTEAEILEDYPYLEAEDFPAVLLFAASWIEWETAPQG